MEKIGLIAAMQQESKALLRRLEDWKPMSFGSLRGASFRLVNRECLLITTGMGLKRAEEGTRALLAEMNPHLLISFGIAGAVEDDLNIGDVVVSGNSFLLDKGMLGQPQSLFSLSDAAWNAATQALSFEEARLVAGTAITTRGSQVVQGSLENIAHPILEMETTGIARVAAEKNIPLVSIRSISDGPKAPIPINLEAVMDENHNFRIGKMLGIVLRDPGILFRSKQMMVNSGRAAKHAAIALVAVLSQPSPIVSM